MSDSEKTDLENSDIYFEPVVKLPPVTYSDTEENEECVFSQRAKLFRCVLVDDTYEWKERGTGVLKILRHKESNDYRILMRRDKTLKVCANHYILPEMKLRPNCGSNRAFVWTVLFDFADEVLKKETLGVRFSSAENASLFKEKFIEGMRLDNKQTIGNRSKVDADGDLLRTTNRISELKYSPNLTSPGTKTIIHVKDQEGSTDETEKQLTSQLEHLKVGSTASEAGVSENDENSMPQGLLTGQVEVKTPRECAKQQVVDTAVVS